MNKWNCDKVGNKTRPEKWKSYSGDDFFNLPQNWDINDWILQTHNDFINARFGGFSIGSGNTIYQIFILYDVEKCNNKTLVFSYIHLLHSTSSTQKNS